MTAKAIIYSLTAWIGLLSLAALAVVAYVAYRFCQHLRERRRERFHLIADPVRPLRRESR